jgi:hypothetical protein
MSPQSAAFPEVLGFAQWPPGDVLTDDGAARKWIFHARDFHLMFRSKKSGPDCSEARPIRRAVYIRRRRDRGSPLHRPKAWPTLPPLIVVRMHPLVGRDLALLRELDHMHGHTNRKAASLRTHDAL